MRGGYQILDLRGLNIQPNDTEVSITDEYVLEQLLKIGDFIDDEAGLIANQLKPINILLPASSGYANLSLAEAGTLLIDAMVLGGHFVLTVVYGTAQDDYGNWVKYVDSAEYSYTELQSGTKLYKHEIAIKADDGNETTYHLCVINSNSQAYERNNIDLIPDLLCMSYIDYNGTVKYGTLVRLYQYDNVDDFISIEFAEDFNGIALVEIEDEYTFVDTVTEL